MPGIPIEGLSPTQEKAVVALLSEPTVAKAAETAGVSPRTIYRWLDSPDFARQFRRLRREAFSQATALAQRYAPMAIGTLAKIMSDPSASHASRVSAAAALLKFARDSIELDELVGRVDALEIAAGIVRPRPEEPAIGFHDDPPHAVAALDAAGTPPSPPETGELSG